MQKMHGKEIGNDKLCYPLRRVTSEESCARKGSLPCLPRGTVNQHHHVPSSENMLTVMNIWFPLSLALMSIRVCHVHSRIFMCTVNMRLSSIYLDTFFDKCLQFCSYTHTHSYTHRIYNMRYKLY